MNWHHIGVATDETEGLLDLWADLFEVPVVHRETFQDLEVTFLDCGEVYLELLEPLPDATGSIPSFLDRNGPGLHHVAVSTDDAAGTLDHARAIGVEPIDEEPRAGAWGHEVAFLHPEDTGGVLVELVET
jgi:methylmalonyl-CoA/ethylmalonyl-CoA epimerase